MKLITEVFQDVQYLEEKKEAGFDPSMMAGMMYYGTSRIQ